MYIVIVNSNAGQKHYNKILKQLKKRLHKTFVPYFTNQFQAEMFWNNLSREISKKKEEISGIIIVGGDGTLHHTVHRLYHHHIPFGIIPSGSGNDFSRAIHIKKSTKKAIDRIIENNPKAYDLLEADNKTALSIVSVGVDAITALECQNSNIKKILNKAFLGRLAYLAVFFKTIFRYKPINVKIWDEKDNEHIFNKVWVVACGNTSYYGGGVPICPNADPQDGELNLVIAHDLSLLQLIIAFPSVLFKKHLIFTQVTELKGKRFLIKTKEGNAEVQGDGEYLGQSPVDIKVKKQAIRIF